MRPVRTLNKRAKRARRREIARRQFVKALQHPIDPQVFIDVGRMIQEVILDLPSHFNELSGLRVEWPFHVKHPQL